MNQMIRAEPLPLPEPRTAIQIRAATRRDVPAIDVLQKRFGKALGFFPRAQLEGYIDAENILAATDASGTLVGYIASKDRYLKRDELGAIFQLCVAPGEERKFVGATLLREVFNRSSYGTRLYCCWCAQDLPANRFWEAMGFVPLAFRGGSERKNRVHIFWQKRIRAGDTTTPYWFPAKTEGGAIREDRIILPIPPGMRWTDELPVLKTGAQEKAAAKRPRKALPANAKPLPATRGRTVMQWRTPGTTPANQPPPVQTVALPAKVEKPRTKCDPRLIAKARELRDRWLEHINDHALSHGSGKYDVARIAA